MGACNPNWLGATKHVKDYKKKMGTTKDMKNWEKRGFARQFSTSSFV